MRREESTLPAILPLGVMALFIIGLLTSVPSAVVRLLRGDALAIWASQVFKLTIGPMVVVACFGVLLLLARRTLRLDVLSLALAGFGTLAILVGIYGHVEGTNLPAHAVNHLASIALIVGLYTFGLNLQGIPLSAFRKGLDAYCGASLLVYGLSLVTYVLARSSGPGYWGFGVDVLLAVTWFVASGRPLAALAASGLILLNGKRMYTVGWIVAVCVLLLALRRERGWRWMGRRAAMATAVGGGLALGIVGGLAAGLVKVPRFVEETAKKWGLLTGSAGSFDLDRASAGRLTDILRPWRFLAEDPLRWFVGGGVGHWWWDRGAAYDQAPTAWQTHYTHFSPLNFVTLGGLPLTIVVAMAIAWKLYQSWRLMPSLAAPTRPIVLALLAFVTARLVEGMFANLYFSDASLWFAFGVLGAASAAGLRSPTRVQS